MQLERARELVDQFHRQRLLVIGDIVLDCYIRGAVERLDPEAPVPILHAHTEEIMTGGAGNVAKNIARFGASATLVSVVGADDAASDVRTAAEREGYVALLLPDASRPTIRKMRYLTGKQRLLRVDYEKTHDVSPEVEEQLIQAILEAASHGVDGILVSDYAKGVITRRVAEVLLDLAGEKDVLLGADVKPSRAPYFVGATFVSPNLKEGHEYLDLDFLEYRREPDEIAKRVYSRLCSDVYLTLSANGMYVYCGGEAGQHVAQAYKGEVYDASGAGDTAVVVLMLSLLSGAQPAEAAELANAAGAVVVGKIGTVGPTCEELLAMVHKYA